MAFVCLPINVSGAAPAYSAQNFRDALSTLLAPHTTGSARPLGGWTGRRPGSWIVTAATPGGAITVAPGEGVLDVQTPVATGSYFVSSDANDTSLTLAARHATLDRNDIVSIRVDDNDVDSSGARQAIPVYTQGTAGGGAPATPARCFRLGTILVPSVANGGATAVTMDQSFTAALGGILPVTAATNPSVGYDMQAIGETDTSVLKLSDGSAWFPSGRVGGPLGKILIATGPASTTDYSTSTATVLSTSFNAVNGRSYKVTCAIFGTQITNAGAPQVRFFIDGIEHLRPIDGGVPQASAGFNVGGTAVWTYTAASTVSVPVLIQANSSASAYRILGGGCQVTVEDIGT